MAVYGLLCLPDSGPVDGVFLQCRHLRHRILFITLHWLNSAREHASLGDILMNSVERLPLWFLRSHMFTRCQISVCTHDLSECLQKAQRSNGWCVKCESFWQVCTQTFHAFRTFHWLVKAYSSDGWKPAHLVCKITAFLWSEFFFSLFWFFVFFFLLPISLLSEINS